MSGRKTPFSAIGTLFSGCRSSPNSAARPDRFGTAPEAHSAGCSDLLQFCFLFPRAGIPQRKIFINDFSIYLIDVSFIEPPRDGGWSFLKQTAFRNFSGHSCFLILPMGKVRFWELARLETALLLPNLVWKFRCQRRFLPRSMRSSVSLHWIHHLIQFFISTPHTLIPDTGSSNSLSGSERIIRNVNVTTYLADGATSPQSPDLTGKRRCCALLLVSTMTCISLSPWYQTYAVFKIPATLVSHGINSKLDVSIG